MPFGRAVEIIKAMSALAARLLSRSFGSQPSDQLLVFLTPGELYRQVSQSAR
jgi:hypothetical protein